MQNNKISFISSPKITKLKHGWFTRYGGVSSGDYESLNIKKGMEDPLENVQENIIRAASALKLKPSEMVFIRHNFRDNILVVDDKTSYGYHQNYDATITNRKDVWLGQGTADCGTVIISDSKNSFVALVHCSWHTTKLNILPKVISKIKLSYGVEQVDLTFSFGPMACWDCFEFGLEATWFFDQKYLKRVEGRLLYNIKQNNIDQLLTLGVDPKNIWDSGICTIESPDFFSYRRSKKQGRETGRLLSAVGL